jgi:SPP1 gp7 family putative phage head morphogenesis protein
LEPLGSARLPALTLDAPRRPRRRRERVGKPQAQPLQIEIAFKRRVDALFDRLAGRALAIATARAGRLTRDAADDERAAIVQGLEDELDFGPEEASALVGAVAVHNARQMRRSLRPANDEEVPSSRPERRARLRAVRPADDARALAVVIPELSRTSVERHAKRTVREIRGIARSVAARLASVVARAVSEGVRGEVLAQELQRRLGLERKVAQRRAIAQVIRINAAIRQERHEKLGVTEYIWRSVDDQHTRRWHRKLNGTRQRYDSPPRGGGGGPHDHGHPGTADVCRCQDLPVIPLSP